MGAQPAAPIGSRTQRKGIVGVEQDTVLVENRPVSYVSAPHSCRLHGKNEISKGAPTVLVYGKPLARVNDKASCGCKIVSKFAPTVLVGDAIGEAIDEALDAIDNWLLGATPYGKGIRIVGSAAFVREMTADLDRLKSIPTGRKILERIEDPKLRKSGRVTIEEKTRGCDGTMLNIDPLFESPQHGLKQIAAAEVERSPDHPDRLIVTKPGPGVPAEKTLVRAAPGCQDACVPEGGTVKTPIPRFLYLGHELIHAIHMMEGTGLRDYPNPRDLGSNLEEAQTMGTEPYVGTPMTENAMRDEIGLARRAGHATMCPAGASEWPIRRPGRPNL